jgi:hypothetical protein
MRLMITMLLRRSIPIAVAASSVSFLGCSATPEVPRQVVHVHAAVPQTGTEHPQDEPQVVWKKLITLLQSPTGLVTKAEVENTLGIEFLPPEGDARKGLTWKLPDEQSRIFDVVLSGSETRPMFMFKWLANGWGSDIPAERTVTSQQATREIESAGWTLVGPQPFTAALWFKKGDAIMDFSSDANDFRIQINEVFDSPKSGTSSVDGAPPSA